MTDTGERTTRRYLSLLGTLLIWGIVAIDAWYLWPTQLGGDTSIVVVSGKSMEPTFFGGDLVIARKMEPSVGDVIVYAPEGFGGSQIVHRIVGGDAADGWVMQGDNNPRVDPFTPKAGEIRGVVLVHYSNFGRVTVLLLNPMVWAFVLLAAMVLMLWYTGDDCDDRDDDEKKGLGGDEGDPESEAEEDEPDLIDRVVEGAEAAVSRMVASIGASGAAAFAGLTSRARVLRPVSLVPLRVSAILAVVGLLAVSSMSPASASQLIVSAGAQPFATTAAKCDSLTLAAEATGLHDGINYFEVTVTGVSGACSGLPVTIYVHDSSGSLIEMGSGTTTSPSTAVSFPKFRTNKADEVVVKIDGWLFLASWS